MRWLEERCKHAIHITGSKIGSGGVLRFRACITQLDPQRSSLSTHTRPATLPTTWRIACSTNRLRPMSWTSGPRQRCPPGKHQQRGAYLIAPPPLHQVGHDSEAHPFTTKGHGVRRTRMMGINVSLSPLISYVLKHYPLAPNPSITRAFHLAPLPLLYHHTHTHTDQRSLALGCTG